MEGFLTIVIPIVFGAIIWSIRLEGRVNSADLRHADLKELLNEKFDAMDYRLERMERAMNGALKDTLHG